MLKKLTDIGFKKVGVWTLNIDEPKLTLDAEENSTNILYSFVVDGTTKYIGQTTQTLRKRMYGYQKPGSTQSTNIRNNANIKNALEYGSVIESYVLLDHGLLHFRDFHLNLAVGLEDSAISDLSPEWNTGGL